MLYSKIVALVAVSWASLSEAAVAAVERSSREITSVDFEGTMINYYTYSLRLNVNKGARSLLKRDNQCGASDFEPAPPPFADVSRCQALASYIYTVGASWVVQHPGPVEQTRIIWTDTCSFGASTNSNIEPFIGNEDVGDLITDGIARLQSGGVVCAQGNMLCLNTGPIIADMSPVFWALYRGPGV
ncbi:hypothetical protein GQ53DRAFT_838335 [Thozetella sp. PMI_491]|nr:hypothetical protein GQ53DRAFT_838335 [Thozetella sp. PMI_491]